MTVPAVFSKKSRYAIVASRFNEEITRSLVKGAQASFQEKRVPKNAVEIVWVPGAFELPLTVLQLAKSKRYQAIVAVGCILAGETPQFEYLSNAVYQGLTTASLMSGIPVTSGVVTAKSRRHAQERARIKGLNRGGEAAVVALEMVQVLTSVRRRGEVHR